MRTDEHEDQSRQAALNEAARVNSLLRLLFPGAGFRAVILEASPQGAPLTLRMEWVNGLTVRSVGLALGEPGIAGSRLPENVLRVTTKRGYRPGTVDVVRKTLLEAGYDSGDEALYDILSGHDLPDEGASLRLKILSRSKRVDNVVSLRELREKKHHDG